MDIDLFYREKGQGFPLLLLHGNGEDGTYFSHQMDYFSKSYRVIALDTRGHGQSPRGTAAFSIGQFAEDLFDWMNAQEIEKAIVLGFSDGANIATRFALRHPDRVSRLILNGGNLNAKGVKPSVQLPITLGYHLARFFAKWSPNAQKKRELLGLMVNDPNILPRELAGLTMPTLVIAGTRDMIREDHTKLIAASIPRGQPRLIPGTHFIANQEHAAFNAAVEDFLSATGGIT